MSKEENTLIVVKGDKLSDLVLKACKKAGFKGNIITLFPEEILHFGSGLPSLNVDNRHYGPISLNAYIETKKSFKEILRRYDN